MISVRTIYSDDYTEHDLSQMIDLMNCNPNDLGTYDVTDWAKKPGCFLYVFLTQQRFTKDKGGVVLVEENGKLCGFSGFNRSDFHPEVYVLGVRTLIDSTARNKLLMSNYFIPTQLYYASKYAKLALFLFNPSNKNNLYYIHKKGKLNLFLQNKLGDLPIWSKLKSVDFLVNVNYTSQNALFIQIDDTFEFDWNTIRDQNV